MDHGGALPHESAEVIAAIVRESGVRARSHLSGREVTTVAAGGPIHGLFEPESAKELQALLASINRNGGSFRILGAGSNLLIDDSGIVDCVIRLGGEFREVVSVSDHVVDVGAACGLMRVSRSVSAAGLSGLEFASGIPASVGGAVRMNAGAHGGQIADIVEWVECIGPDGTFRMSAAELGFGYRRSTLPVDSIVVRARMRLTVGNMGEIERRRGELLAYRKATQPLTLPSFGSVFKNPSTERSAGAILEAAGLKGRRIGGAEVSSLHGNWIVNPERLATVGDIVRLIALCRSAAAERGEPDLQPEVVFWGREANQLIS